MVPGTDGKVDVVSGLRGKLNVDTWDGIVDHAAGKPETQEVNGPKENSQKSAGSELSASNSSTLYAAAIFGDVLLLRQGNPLVYVSLDSTKQKTTED